MQRDRMRLEQLVFPPLSALQVQEFRRWWRDDLLLGAAWFGADWPTPQGRQEMVRRFRGAPTFSFIAGGYWRVTATTEVRGAGALPFVPEVSFLEDFESGLGAYELLGGNGSLFTVVPTAYGQSLNAASQSSTVPATIRRFIPQALTVKTISLKFRISAAAADDACTVALYQGSLVPFAFIPKRERALDSSERALLILQGSSYFVTPSTISVNTWYSLLLRINAGAGQSTLSITNLATSAQFSNINLSGVHAPFEFNQLLFAIDSGGTTAPTLYDDIFAEV